MFNFLKIVFLIILLFFIIKEYKNIKAGKNTINLGMLIMISIFISPAPLLSCIFEILFMLIWLIIYKYKFKKMKKFKTSFLYAIPIIFYLMSYSFGMIIKFGTVSFLVLFQIYLVVASFIFLSFLILFIYSFINIFYVKIKTKEKLKIVIGNFNTNYYIFCYLLPYISIILI